VCASCALLEQVDRASGLGLTSNGIEADEFYWASLKLAGGACIAAIVALIFFRERLSDGARSSLLVVAVAGSYPWPIWPLESLHNHLIVSYGIQDASAADYAVFVGFYAVENLVPAAIGAAALSDVIRGRLRAGTMAGIGLALAAVNLVVCLALYLPEHFTSMPPLVLIAAPASAGLFGCVVLQVSRACWRRWCASG
jgi:hypothetical protein